MLECAAIASGRISSFPPRESALWVEYMSSDLIAELAVSKRHSKRSSLGWERDGCNIIPARAAIASMDMSAKGGGEAAVVAEAAGTVEEDSC
jgi:hypothetical protein